MEPWPPAGVALAAWRGIAVAPTRDPILHGASAAFWRRGVAGVRLEGAARALLRTPVLTRTARLNWLAPPVAVRYPLAGLARIQVRVRFRITRDGALTGFVVVASPDDGRAGAAAREGQSLLLPLPEPTPVARGNLVRAAIAWQPGPAGGRWTWRWAVQMANGEWRRGGRTHGAANARPGEGKGSRWRGRARRRGGHREDHSDS